VTWAPDYVTSDELKDYVRIADTQDDVQVALAVTAASRAVDLYAGRQFGKVDSAEDRFYRATWRHASEHWHWGGFRREHVTVEIDDLMDQTGLTVTVDGTATTDFVLLPRNAAATARPWTSLRLGDSITHVHDPEITVHAPWGWSGTPDTIKQATLLQGSRFLARRDSPYGVAGSPEAGNEIRLLPKLDPDVALTIRPYYRWWGAR
jgi:hypothetical protein